MPVTAGRNNSGLWTRRIRPSAYVKRYDDTVPRPIYISVHASRSDPTVSIDDWSTENSQIQARSHARTHAYTHGFEPHLGVFVCVRARVCRGFHGLQIIRLTWIRLDLTNITWLEWTVELMTWSFVLPFRRMASKRHKSGCYKSHRCACFPPNQLKLLARSLPY